MIELTITLIGVLSLVLERLFSLMRETKNSECLVGGHRVVEVRQEHFDEEKKT